jgi:hypothetical protein
MSASIFVASAAASLLARSPAREDETDAITMARASHRLDDDVMSGKGVGRDRRLTAVDAQGATQPYQDRRRPPVKMPE